MKTPLEVALHYRMNLGWSVVPNHCPFAKNPNLKEWKPYTLVLPKEEEIRNWFTGKTWNNTGISVITGRISNLLVVDIDDHDGGMHGLSSTMIAKSGGGGHHLYFKYNPLYNVSKGEIQIDGVRVELMGNDHVIVLPPSIHYETKKRYEWEVYAPTDLKELDADSIKRFVMEKEKKTADSDFNVQEGNRNQWLSNKAYSLYMKGMKGDDVFATLLGYNAKFESSLPESEVKSIVLHKQKFEKKSKDDDEEISVVPPRMAHELAEMAWQSVLDERNAISTGYSYLDRIIAGVVRGRLYTFTAETNMGKTTFSANLAVNVAERGGKVLYISLEPAEKILTTLQSAKNRCLYKEIKDQEFLAKKLDNIYVTIQEECDTPKKMKKIIEEYGKDFELVIVDHVGYFVGNDDTDLIKQQSKLLKEFALFAKKQRIAIWLIAHPRKPSNKQGKISIHDISGSAAFYQDSTDVIVLTRAPIDKDNPEVSQKGVINVFKTKSAGSSDLKSCSVIFTKGGAFVGQLADENGFI